jgi:hypothetical protein
MVRTEPECRARRKLELARAAPFFPEGCAEATWRIRHHHLNDFAAEPPAHYRLVSGHDLFRRRGLVGLYRRDSRPGRLNAIGDRGVQRNDALGHGSFLLVGQKRHFSRSRQDRVGAPGCAGQGRHLAAREAGRLVARRSRRAKIGRGLGRFLWSAIENQAKGIVTPKGPRRRKRLGRARRGRARPRGARFAQTIFEIDQKKDPHMGVSIHPRA